MADSSDRPSDNELVEACNHADADAATRAFEALYRRHRNYVLRVAMRHVRDAELAADVLQETFTYLLGLFPPTGKGLVLTARMTTYLYPVAKNFAISAARKHRRFPISEDVVLDDLPGAPPARSEVESDDLDRALARVGADRREILTLRFVDDLSLEEIAQALEIPLGTVKSRLHLAIKALREDPKIKDLFDQ
jgi:RNA polymerase sigma-70 factor (ECF subfamily)